MSEVVFSKNTYYRFIKESRYNWRKLLLLSTIKLLNKDDEHRLIIINDTGEVKKENIQRLVTTITEVTNTLIKLENMLHEVM